MRPARLVLPLLLLATVAAAGVREVELSLPVRAKLALTGREKLFLGPFLREVKGDEAAPKLGFSVEAEFERDMASAAQSRDFVAQLRAAERRLKSGEYGWCEDCGNPIGVARLSAAPAATRCITCQGARERPGLGAVSR